MAGGRKKSSKLAAQSAAISAVGESVNGHGEEEKSIIQHPRTILGVLLISFFSYWFVANSNQTLPVSNFNTTELFNLSNYDINLSSSNEMLKTAYNEFYADTVQPLVDMGMRSFNSTKETEESSRIGYQLQQQNASAKYPIVMIPGFVTSGLEVWQAKACMKKHFRQRIWGSASMASLFFGDRQCWREHLTLNRKTGMDKEQIRVRAAQGFEAADNFIATYWVWSRIIENLADVGYDGSLMTMMSYDWRLGYKHMEERDGYFTKLKHTIEAHYITSGEKVVMISHSMGGTVGYFFLQWVVADVKNGGGGGGKGWVEKYIHSFINIAGTLLGVPKSIPSLLSGELKDTAQMFPQVGELLEQYFGRRWRRNLWTTWGSLYGMLPKGGDGIWGIGADLSHANEDSNTSEDNTANVTSAILQKLMKLKAAPAIVFSNGTEEICPISSLEGSNAFEENTTPIFKNSEKGGFTAADLHIPESRKWSMTETIQYLMQKDQSEGGSYHAVYSLDTKEGWKKKGKDHRFWSDPIATPLPKAPSLKIYCLYGTGLETERSYHYKVQCDKLPGSLAEKSCPIMNVNETSTANISNLPGCSVDVQDMVEQEDEPLESPLLIDTTAKDETQNIQNGVRFSDGDATVPLISLGYMCQKWSEPKNAHNPSGIKVYTREKKHAAEVLLSDPGRSGPNSGEHVDILGNVGVIEDVVRIATDFQVKQKVDEEVIVSDLKRIVKAIDDHEHGGSDNIIR